MTAAKVVMNERSQAIRLPKEFRVSGTEVALQRVPQGILIMERDPWEVCREACQDLSDDFMTSGVLSAGVISWINRFSERNRIALP